MDTFKRLREHLHRLGRAWYYWVSETKASTWGEVGNDLPIPHGRFNVYFNVNPSREIKGVGQRTTLDDVSAINALFSEFDTKMFPSRQATIERIRAIPIRPSLVVSSGGGFHGYWLLKEPYVIDDRDKLLYAKNLQASWVTFTNGDKGAKDLARVLRVPGTRNMKPDYAPNYPLCNIVFSDFTRQYAIEQFEALIPKEEKKERVYVPRKLGDSYFEKVLESEMDRLVRAREGERNDTLNKVAFNLGLLIPKGLNQMQAENMLLCGALAIGLSEKESSSTIDSGIKKGIEKSR